MRKLFKGLIVLIVLVVAGLLVAPSFIPADIYKDRISQAASDATGREVAILGDINFAFFPDSKWSPKMSPSAMYPAAKPTILPASAPLPSG